MNSVKQNIGLTNNGQLQEGYKNTRKYTSIRISEKGISVIRISLQNGRGELISADNHSATIGVGTEKMQKVVGEDESDAHRTKNAFFNI